jgi:hypothetical protein
MRASLVLVAVVLSVALVPAARATGVKLDVILAGEIKPGVYGRIEIGNRPPPVYYPEPVVIIEYPHPVAARPVYLHVPPGHAKNWRKHCHRYDACGVPVYFVMSEEYDSGYHPHKKGKHNRHGGHSGSED